MIAALQADLRRSIRHLPKRHMFQLEGIGLEIMLWVPVYVILLTPLLHTSTHLCEAPSEPELLLSREMLLWLLGTLRSRQKQETRTCLFVLKLLALLPLLFREMLLSFKLRH